jgi:hypothetical protein
VSLQLSLSAPRTLRSHLVISSVTQGQLRDRAKDRQKVREIEEKRGREPIGLHSHWERVYEREKGRQTMAKRERERQYFLTKIAPFAAVL